MYGKIFDSMYKGTLYGQWEAIVTFQQMIVLCDADGTVDMTPPAIAAITSIPLDIIQKGIEVLSRDDPYSRTPGRNGRRIELIDEHRPWGWVIVNHHKYKNLQDSDTVRAQTKERVRKHREMKRPVTDGNAGVTDGNGSKRHTNTNTNTNTSCGEPIGSPPFITLTANDGSEIPITDSQCEEWGTLFPAVDVPQELRNMRAWLIANPRNRKTASGMPRFATSWLSRAQNAARKQPPKPATLFEGAV